jgi:hypothetical protein
MIETCTVGECTREVYARGYCRKHYDRWRKHDDPTIVHRKKRSHRFAGPELIDGVYRCTVHECMNVLHARGLCRKHYDWARIDRSSKEEPTKPGFPVRNRRTRKSIDTTQKPLKRCTEDGCQGEQIANGLCQRCYMREYMREYRRW